MYAGIRGVRIEMDLDMFAKVVVPEGKYGVLNIGSEGLVTLFTPEEQWNSEYSILYQGESDPNFFRKIEYVEDNIKLSMNAISQPIKEGKVWLNVDTSKIGKYKNIRWSFQEEVRFNLTIAPKNIDPSIGPIGTIHAMQLGVDLPFYNYDVNLDEGKLENMKIVMSPYSTPSDEIMLRALVNDLNPKAEIKKSALQNILRPTRV